MKLKPALSAYLDFMRFVAAFAVLLGHMDQDGIAMAWMPLSRFSHEAVVIFFVLSGFIIYYSTTSRTSTWRQYAVARLSRIYSVALPSVLACVLLAWVLSHTDGFDPARLSNYRQPLVVDIIYSLLFLNESWLPGTNVPLNDPYWSLCYEVWFYVLFGAHFFARGLWRWVLVGAAALVAGPAILLLMPIWLMGAKLASSGGHESRLAPASAWLAFLGPIVLIVFINLTDLDSLVQKPLYEHVPGYWRFDGSQRFVTDYMIGAALCLHIAAFSSLPVAVQGAFARHQRFFASLAGFSFTLYLFHRPMTQLLGAYLPQPEGAVLVPVLLAAGILLACWGISWGTEKRLSAWRTGFARLLPPPAAAVR